MTIKQLSVFMENKPGSLNAACQVLKKNHLSIRTLSLADTREFGILRLLLPEWEKAREVLEQAGFAVKVTDVVALLVEDRAGGLADLLEIAGRSALNVEYMYAFPFGCKGKAAMVFRFDDAAAASKVFADANVGVLSFDDLQN
ncbi:MAG: amino acid-binding protein [Victivallaceae bacterium]|nr:amino acid-binding protein [Victivallaceae bacterium]